MTREWIQDGGHWSQVLDELKVTCYIMLSPWDVHLHCTGKAHSPDSQAGSEPLPVPPPWSTQILSCDITPQPQPAMASWCKNVLWRSLKPGTCLVDHYPISSLSSSLETYFRVKSEAWFGIIICLRGKSGPLCKHQVSVMATFHGEVLLEG